MMFQQFLPKDMIKSMYQQKKLLIFLNIKAHKYVIWIFLFLFILLNILFTGCSKASGIDDNKLIIAASILPVAGFAEQLCGSKAEIEVVVPPGAEPHTFEPTPGQLKKISEADVYIMVGSGIDFELTWIDKIKGVNPDMVFIDCSNGIDLIENTEVEPENKTDPAEKKYHTDPHIWLSPKNAGVMVENIYNGLIEIDPSNKEYYLTNKIMLQVKLSDLDKKIRDILSDKKNKKILVFHPAWTYFAKDYGIEQVSVEEDGKEPTIKDMMDLIDQAKKSNIKVIFTSPEFSIRSAEIIADEIGGSVVLLSPLEKDYISGLDKAANAFAESMD